MAERLLEHAAQKRRLAQERSDLELQIASIHILLGRRSVSCDIAEPSRETTEALRDLWCDRRERRGRQSLRRTLRQTRKARVHIVELAAQPLHEITRLCDRRFQDRW